MKKLWIFSILMFFGLNAWTQSNLTLYHMKTLPQNMYANPAFTPESNLFIGVPGISSMDMGVSSNGLALRKINNAFVPIQGTDSFDLQLEELFQVFKNNLYVNSKVNIDLIHFGFKKGKNFFTFNVTEKIKSRVDVPVELFELVLEGNGGENLGRTFNFNPGLDIIHSREYALGINRSFLDDDLHIGARAKYLYGLNIIETERSDLNFTTDEDDFSYLLNSDVKFNMASSIFSLDSFSNPDMSKMFYGAKNHGWGLDLGIEYKLNKRITLSASIVDLGMISWKENVRNHSSENPNASFEFKGFDLKSVIKDSLSFTEVLENLTDSLVEVFGLDSTAESFNTGLMSEFYLGGTYSLNHNHTAGVLLYGSFYNRKFYPAVTLSWNSRFGKLLGVSVSYSAMRDNYFNAGLGLSINGGSFQYYLVSDNLIGNTASQIKNISIRTGFNFTFGRK
ncbi:MAG: hypothetical protein JXR19_00465 [Bacteroidia bacterium]